MEEGTILRWLVEDGHHVAVGQELVEIETDKAVMAHTAEAAGVLSLIAAEGETLPVGAPIARIDLVADAVTQGAPPAPAQLSGDPEPAEAPFDPLADEPTSGLPAGPVAVDARPVAGNGNDRGPRASPLARRTARQHGVSLEHLSGTGPRGRIVRADVTAAAGIDPAEPAPQPPRPAAATDGSQATTARRGVVADSKGHVTTVSLSRLQLLIARRMTEAKASVPEFVVQTDVQMDEVVAQRERLKELSGEQPPPSLNDIVVKASAIALRDHPRANGSYRDGAFELHERINIGVAVATDDALIVPTVFAADTKGLAQIARETRELAQRVRTGQITPAELAGGTFTVSNLGMFGMTAITPVINAPQAAILGVGALRNVLARREGRIVEHAMLTLTLTCDHRILYGADAAKFLARIRELLETPLMLAL
jgi:pyruvate dehydrogenase E2 component (dihydrolipoamide acetyltransferase)